MGKYDSIGAGAAKGQRHYDEMALRWAQFRSQQQAQNFDQQRKMAMDEDARQRDRATNARETERIKREDERVREKNRFDRESKRDANRASMYESERKARVDAQKYAIDSYKAQADIADKDRKFMADREDESVRRMEWDIENFRANEAQRIKRDEFEFQLGKYMEAQAREDMKKQQTEASFAALASSAMRGGDQGAGRMFAPKWAVDTFNELNPGMNIAGLSIMTQDHQGRALPQPVVAYWTPRMGQNGKPMVDANGAPVFNTNVLSPEQFAHMNAYFEDGTGKYQDALSNMLPSYMQKGAKTSKKDPTLANMHRSLAENQMKHAKSLQSANTNTDALGNVTWTNPSMQQEVDALREKANQNFNAYSELSQDEINQTTSGSAKPYDLNHNFVTGGEVSNPLPATSRRATLKQQRKEQESSPTVGKEPKEGMGLSYARIYADENGNIIRREMPEEDSDDVKIKRQRGSIVNKN